jgi:hypothetical protein
MERFVRYDRRGQYLKNAMVKDLFNCTENN